MGETVAIEDERRAIWLRHNIAKLSKAGVLELLEIERKDGLQAVYKMAEQISRLTEENERLRKVADDKLGDFYLEAWEVAADALHKELLLQVEHLMDSKEGTPAAQRLSYLAELVGAYEEARFGVEE